MGIKKERVGGEGSRTPVLRRRRHASTGLVEAYNVGDDIGTSTRPVTARSRQRVPPIRRARSAASPDFCQATGSSERRAPRPSNLLLTQRPEGILHHWQIKGCQSGDGAPPATYRSRQPQSNPEHPRERYFSIARYCRSSDRSIPHQFPILELQDAGTGSP